MLLWGFDRHSYLKKTTNQGVLTVQEVLAEAKEEIPGDHAGVSQPPGRPDGGASQLRRLGASYGG